jgi:periplasmic protein TonB
VQHRRRPQSGEKKSNQKTYKFESKQQRPHPGYGGGSVLASTYSYAEQQRKPGKHVVGIGIVILMHVLLGWALVSGLARKVVEVIKNPIETKIIEEVKPPPPPPENLPPPPPKLAPPPPSFVPPPEVVVAPPPTPAPAITVQTTTPPPPTPVTIAPAPAPAAPPAPAVAPVAAQPAITNVSACKPEYPQAALKAEASGTTAIKFTIDATGKVVSADVVKTSGASREHRLLDRAAVTSLSGCTFRPGRDASGQAVGAATTVEYVWKLE